MKPGFTKNEGGGIAIIFALMLPVLIGAIALAVETGYWFMVQRQAQHAADVAAYTAALRISRDDDLAAARAGATGVARASGLPEATGEVVVTLLDEHRVEVVVTDTRERLFSRIFLDGPIALQARAVARISREEEEGVPVCMLAMSPDADRAIDLQGSASVTLADCAVEARSTSSSALSLGGASRMEAACVNLAGGHVGNEPVTTECDEVRTGVPVRGVPRQLLDMPTVSNAGSVPDSGGGAIRDATLTPQDVGHPSGLPMMRFQGDVTFQRDIIMAAGVYIFDGGQISTQGRTSIDASAGVAIYLMNGARLNFGNNTTADIQAMRDGPWADVVIFDSQDAASRRTHVLVGSRITGVIYTPEATMEFSGGTGVDDGCFMLIMSRFYFTGSADITANCTDSNFDLDVFNGGAAGPGDAVIDLVE